MRLVRMRARGRSHVHTWCARACSYVLVVRVSCMLFLSGTRTRLTPSFHGSMARCLGFAPIYSGALLRFVQPPVSPCPLRRSFPHLRWCPPSSSLSTCTILCLTRSVRSFVPSFVRVTLAESTPAFRRLQCARQLLFSRPSPSLFPFALPYPPPPAPGHPRLRSSLFRGSRSSFPVPIRTRFHG